MGYKQIEPNMTFAEASLMSSMEHNRSLKRLEKINQVIDWSQVEEILMSHYTVGGSREGADAYPPLMLLKGLLLQKKRETPEGKLDKNGNLLKFSRDLDSDWVVKKGVLHYGFNEHASVDTNHGFVLATELTPASVNDSIYLPYCVTASCHTAEPIKKVYADKGYYGEPNRDFLHMNGIADGIMRRDTRTTKLTDYEKERNKRISKKRYIVEQYFGLSHLHSRAFRARFTRIVKNALDGLVRQMAFNLFRGGRILGTV